MIWSKYAHLFHSARNGWLLYHAAYNSFLQVDDALADELHKLIAAPDKYDFSPSPQTYLMLRAGGYLVEAGKDDELYSILKMRRLTQNFDGQNMLLTVAVTRSCNFGCPYCYEVNRSGKPMTAEMEDKLVSFVAAHKQCTSLHVTWYGGEPLLAWDTVLSLDKKLQALGKQYSAFIVTNGSLLTADKIAMLNDMKVTRIQITLDGKQQTHDGRRFFIGGAPSYDLILRNLDGLMQSDYKGQVHIRVNVDSRNEDEFITVYHQIKDRYPKQYGAQIIVYPGFVKGDDSPDADCFYDCSDKGRFLAKLAEKEGVNALPIFPRSQAAGCTMTKRYAYVVGPEGELYKCWDDIGIPEEVVGHIDSMLGWNMGLIAQGAVGCSYLDDPACKDCFYFPVCDGGCAKVRLRNLRDGGKRDCCSYFKYHLDELLELHYEQKLAAKALRDQQAQQGTPQQAQ